MPQPNLSRWSDSELELIKRTFGGEAGLHLLKVMRKVFYPTLDENAPLGQFVDIWRSLSSQFENMAPEDRLVALLCREKLIAHIEGCLITLSGLAAQEPSMTADEVRAKSKRDSTQ
jgi:hypothetical protein